MNAALPHYQADIPVPNASAVLSRSQRLRTLVLAGVFLAAVLVAPRATLQAANVCVIAFYLVFAYYKLLLQFVSVKEHKHPVRPEGIPDSALPPYTIMVPMYREKSAAPGLIRHLGKMDYPREKMQVILLVEEDDAETK